MNKHTAILYSARYIFVLYILIFSLHHGFAANHEISEIFIDSTGHNQHEAKIKAHDLGMQRALFLLASKLKLPAEDITRASYDDLKSVFTPNKEVNILSVSDRYTSTVNYEYDKGALYSLLLKYGSAKINDSFSEFVIIPTFKQGDTFKLWGEDPTWSGYWYSAQQTMSDHKILLPNSNLFYSKSINKKNLFDLTYKNFVEIFQSILFKKVLIIPAEFLQIVRLATALCMSLDISYLNRVQLLQSLIFMT